MINDINALHTRTICSTCKGTGEVPIQWSMMLDGVCDTCNGEGYIFVDNGNNIKNKED